MALIAASKLSELAPGGKKRIETQDGAILLVNVDGTLYAVDDRCPHMGGSLYEGELRGGSIVCPKHGSVFDVVTGKFVKGGKFLFVEIKTKDLRRHDVVVEGNDVLVEADARKE
jgi:3-phenylpropionate/trans-cinnamate dioxygenase ferredoxin subunit